MYRDYTTNVEKKKSRMKDVIDMVVFDLDDTLVPVWSPIQPAMNALFAFMEQKMPLTADGAKANIRSEMNR
jgi:FMN phosphatase YigB (HAD superfamily)